MIASIGSNSSRIEWIDSLKGLGMLLVVLSHTAIDHDTNRYLYSFHMPLFFCISGLLFSPHKYKDLKTLATKRTTTLLVPYFFYAVGSYALWLNVARHYGADAGSGLSVLTPLLGIAYSVGSGEWLVPNCPLWFLTCLFVTECLYWVLDRISRTKFQCSLLFGGCGAVGYLTSQYLAIRLPWGVDVALTAVVFYGLGHLLKPFIVESMSAATKCPSWAVVAMCLAGGLGVFVADGQVDMSRNILGSSLVSFYVSAVCGIVTSFGLIRLVGSSDVLGFIGRQTLPILAMQLPALGAVKAIQWFVFGIPFSTELSLTLGICQAAGILIIVIPLAMVIDRWLPFLAGKSSIRSEITVSAMTTVSQPAT